MNEDSFWELIARWREESAGDPDLMSRLLLRDLCTLTPTEVKAFAGHWEGARTRLDSCALIDAAELLFDTDVDHYRDIGRVRDWIISHGRVMVDQIAQEPDNLVELAADRDNAFEDSFGEFLVEAHIRVTGDWPGAYAPTDTDNVCRHLGLFQRKWRFPRLWAFRRTDRKLDR